MDEYKKPSRSDLIEMLDQMIKNIDGLPTNAMLTPINHYDFCSLLILLSAMFKSDGQSEEDALIPSDTV